MAYVSICENCLNDKCDECLEVWDVAKGPESLGGAFCVCGHGEPESEFQKSVREDLKDK